jgi:hypothetical protein
MLDADRRVVGSAALVVRRDQLPASIGDLGFALRDGAYVALVPAEGRAETVMQRLRAAYGRAKAVQLVEQARRRYRASVHRSVSADGAVTIRVRF